MVVLEVEAELVRELFSGGVGGGLPEAAGNGAGGVRDAGPIGEGVT